MSQTFLIKYFLTATSTRALLINKIVQKRDGMKRTQEKKYINISQNMQNAITYSPFHSYHFSR